MALSTRQKQLVTNSFAKVEPIAEAAADIFYSKLFEYDPSLKKLFKKDIKEQGRMLMSTLKVAVNTLNDLDKLVPVLQNLAKKHLDYGVKTDDYTPVGNALIYTLKTGLGKDFDPETQQAWIETYKIVAQVMREAAYPEFNATTYKNAKHYNH